MKEIHEMEIEEPYYSLIKQGYKPVEGRKMSEKWMKLKIWDKLVITTPDKTKSFLATITGITYYVPIVSDKNWDPLENYLRGETLARALPHVTTLERGKEIYLQWSTAEEIKEMGFMGIQLSVDKF